MDTSQQPDISRLKIYEKVLDFQNNLSAIQKDATNPHFKNKYSSLDNILSEVKPILNALKLILIQPVYEGKVHTQIIDTESGQLLSSSVDIPAGLGSQQLGSCITYLRRYTLTSLLSLEFESDDDGNEAQAGHNDQGLPDQREWLNKWANKQQTATTDNYIKVVEALKSGNYTIDQVKKKYKLNKELESELAKIKP